MNELTARDHQLIAMEPIAHQMPVKFANGAIWENFTSYCIRCNAPHPARLLRGVILYPTPHMASIEAAGICPDCKLLTRITYRLHDDMRLTGPRNGQWRTWRPKVSWWQRLVSLFRIV